MYEFSVHISRRSMGLDLKQLPDETGVKPLDRVLSMYEFSVHISGRSMGLDLKQLPDETLYAARRKMREHYRNLVPTDTRNVWPWTSLSVTMEEDLWDRVSGVDIVARGRDH
ncbi:unnamed protein product [Closterium sp. Naga37s-1]|nr:unnamed protein product [Closterium sp. Naga37s-1]